MTDERQLTFDSEPFSNGSRHLPELAPPSDVRVTIDEQNVLIEFITLAARTS